MLKMGKTRKSRKAQIKMFETIAVLVVFFFLMIFGVSFYFVLQRSSFNKQVERNMQINAIDISQKISDIPELDCVLSGVKIENCIDFYKLQMFAELLKDPAYSNDYVPVFGFSNITVKVIYPGEGSSVILYQKVPTTWRGAYKNIIPMLIFDPVSGFYYMGVMEATVYVQ
jgi:hypothetical protein